MKERKRKRWGGQEMLRQTEKEEKLFNKNKKRMRLIFV